MSQLKPPHVVRNLLKDGFFGAPNLDEGVALTRYVYRLLCRKQPESNDQLVELVHSVADSSSVRTKPERVLMCKKGCSLCCHTHVSVKAPEAFSIARKIRKKTNSSKVLERIKVSSDIYLNNDFDARWAIQNPCGLLENNVCSIYADRPLSCRLYASYDLDACQRSFDGGEDNIPQHGGNLSIKMHMSLSIFAALRAANLPARGYELNQIVQNLIENPELEAEWYSGNDPFEKFSSVQDAPPEPMLAAIDDIIKVSSLLTNPPTY